VRERSPFRSPGQAAREAEGACAPRMLRAGGGRSENCGLLSALRAAQNGAPLRLIAAPQIFVRPPPMTSPARVPFST